MTCLFLGSPKRVKFTIFSILPDPGCLRHLKVASHTDSVVSWDPVGGIQPLVCPQGPPQAGFGVAKKRCARRRARLVGHFGLVRVKFGIFLILPGQGCLVDPKVGSHSDCVAPWGPIEGFQSLFHVLGPLQTSFWAPTRRFRKGSGSFVRQIWLKKGKFGKVRF